MNQKIDINREIWIREIEIQIRKLFPWYLRIFIRRLAGYRRKDITSGCIWRKNGG